MLTRVPWRAPGAWGFHGAGCVCTFNALCSHLEAPTGLFSCGRPTLKVMWRGPNVSCLLPGSVKWEAPFQRTRVHWPGARMPWRNDNFSKRRDLAGAVGSRFTRSKACGVWAAAGLETARCFSVVMRDLEVDRVCVLVLFCAAQQPELSFSSTFKMFLSFVNSVRNSLEPLGNLPTECRAWAVAKPESAA